MKYWLSVNGLIRIKKTAFYFLRARIVKKCPSRGISQSRAIHATCSVFGAMCSVGVAAAAALAARRVAAPAEPHPQPPHEFLPTIFQSSSFLVNK